MEKLSPKVLVGFRMNLLEYELFEEGLYDLRHLTGKCENKWLKLITTNKRGK